MVALSEVATIHGGGRLGLSGKDFVPEGTIPAYGAAGINGYLTTAEYQQTEAIILSSIGARCGKCFYTSGSWTSLANTQVILPNETIVNPKFLWYQLNDEKTWTRSGSAQPFIKPSVVKSRRICLPPLDEQRRIAATLDKTETLRSHLALSQQLLDSLARALFSERFGDVSSSSKYAAPLREVITRIGSGTSHKCEARPRDDDANEPGILKLSAVTQGTFNPRENKAYPAGGLSADNLVRPGDLLMCRKNTKELVGAAALVDAAPENLYLPDLIYRIEYDPEQVTGEFLLNAFQTRGVRRDLEAAASGSSASMANISRARLLNINVRIPPMEDQVNFVSNLHGVRAQQRLIAKQIETFDAMANSLQVRAFRGEL